MRIIRLAANQTAFSCPFQSGQMKTEKLEMIPFLFHFTKFLYFAGSLWALNPISVFFSALYILFTYRINSAFLPSIFISYQYCMNIEYKQGTFHNLNSIWLNDWLNKYSFDDASTLPECMRRLEKGKRQKYAIVHGNNFFARKIRFIPNTERK